MDCVSLLTLGSLVPKGKALRDERVQGREGCCVILGKFFHLPVAPAVQWDRW